MDMTFTDWENGQYSNGQTFTIDWTSPDTVRHQPAGILFGALVNAMTERAAACIQLYPWWEFCEQHGISRTGGNLSPSDLWFTDWSVNTYIDGFLTQFLGSFLDFTVNSGRLTGRNLFSDYNPPYDRAPMLPVPTWSLSSALAAIGMPEFLSFSRHSPLTAEWAWQKKKLLDLMLWKTESMAERSADKDWCFVRRKEGPDSITEADWDNMAWSYQIRKTQYPFLWAPSAVWYDVNYDRNPRVSRVQVKPESFSQFGTQLGRIVKSYWYLGAGGVYMSSDPGYYLYPDWPTNPVGQVAFNANGDAALDMKWAQVPEATYTSLPSDPGMVTSSCWMFPGESKPTCNPTWPNGGKPIQWGYTSWMYPYHCGPFSDFWGDPFMLPPRVVMELNIPGGYRFQPLVPLTVHPT